MKREDIWKRIQQPWDVIVVGGGITGAGILQEAARSGLRALLLEQRDFAWGTSSRSSKLVHGGLRYLQQGKFLLTRSLLRQREQLMREAEGLVDRLGFLTAVYQDVYPGRWGISLLLAIYDALIWEWRHRYYRYDDFHMLAPGMTTRELQGGFGYDDAQTDDARLVFRLLREAVMHGAVALNYATVEELLKDSSGNVTGVRIRDESGKTADAQSRVVMNATGPWADRLRRQVGAPARIRPLRGSHLIFPGWRIPVAQAISFWHPIDGRPIFVIPWEGATLVGTTDLDHDQDLNEEPVISPYEVAYLMASLEYLFPSACLKVTDILSTFSGVRPVVGTGKKDPSRESRDHAIWEENGLLTVTGGKLTTFSLTAREAMRAAAGRLPGLQKSPDREFVFDPVELPPRRKNMPPDTYRRLAGRYGPDLQNLLAAALPGELEPVEGSNVLWAQVRWAARSEGVVHLEDLLLRRTRLGLLLPQGGKEQLPALRRIIRHELGWDDQRWDQEQESYLRLWRRCYSVPDSSEIPDWKAMLERAMTMRKAIQIRSRHRARRIAVAAVAVTSAAALLSTAYAFFKRSRR